MSRAPRILVVDDEVDNCDNISDIFTNVGYDVDVAYDGRAAIGLITVNAYDVAVLDLRMPGMDGLELYRHIKQVSSGTVGIVVTAHPNNDIAIAALKEGVWDLIPKPIEMPRLLTLLAEAVRSPLILVVDDDSNDCEKLWSIFRHLRYRVYTAHSHYKAEEILCRHQFQVVLTNLKLENESGWSMRNLIRWSNQDLQIITLTDDLNEIEARVEQAVAIRGQSVEQAERSAVSNGPAASAACIKKS